MAFAFLKKFFSRDEGRAALVPLYNAAVARARQPYWYLDGAVADTIDGRFDMLSAILSIILFRLESEGEAGQVPSVMLTELFIADMDGQLREEGVGDVGVSKQVGNMLSALGGRLTAYREGLMPGGDLAAALTRNLYRGTLPSNDAVAFCERKLRHFSEGLERQTLGALVSGALLPDGWDQA
jgi:cytochrome b pre-mRNA-processing protein 3